MTRAPMVCPRARARGRPPPDVADTTLGWRLVNPRMKDLDGGKATITLGETAEEVAVLDGICREDSDAWGLRSQQLHGRPTASGWRSTSSPCDPRRRGHRGRGAAAETRRRGAGQAQAGLHGATASSPPAAPRRCPTAPSAIVVASARGGRAPRPDPARAGRGLGLGRRAAAHHGPRPGPSTREGPRALGLGDRRSRRRRDQRGVRDAGHREHPPPRARPGDRQRLRRRHRASAIPSARRASASCSASCGAWRTPSSGAAWPPSASASGRGWRSPSSVSEGPRDPFP